MDAILILFLVGALLLAAEVFLPGVVAGVIGGIALLAGSLLSFREFGLTGGLVASGLAIGLVMLMLYLELVVLPKTAFGRRMVIQSTVAATSQPPVALAAEVMDKPAEALTALVPSGHVIVEGKRYEAFCRSGHADKGAALRVVGLDNFRLIVTRS
jgi:membrane-bound ClpP family serine protease